MKDIERMWSYYLSYDSVFDGKDLIGQVRGLSRGEGEGVKCVWEEETGLEFLHFLCIQEGLVTGPAHS